MTYKSTVLLYGTVASTSQYLHTFHEKNKHNLKFKETQFGYPYYRMIK